MALRTRIIDLLPFVVTLAVVALVATAMVVERVVREPVVVPAAEVTPTHELPSPRSRPGRTA